MKVVKAFIKHSEVPQRIWKLKIKLIFILTKFLNNSGQ